MSLLDNEVDADAVLAWHRPLDDMAAVELAPGVLRRAPYSSERIGVFVIDMEPGTTFPRVDHHDDVEQYLIVSGTFIDNGVVHTAGTFVHYGAESSHRPRTDTGGRLFGYGLLPNSGNGAASSPDTSPDGTSLVAAQQRVVTGHVGINVTDLDRSLPFYAQLLGLQEAFRSDEAGRRYAFLRSGEELVLTLWEQSAGSFNSAAPGLHHLSFRASSPQQLDSATAQVRLLGGTVIRDELIGDGAQDVAGALFFTDPDGTRLELFLDPRPGAATMRAEDRAAPGEAADDQPASPACGFF